MKQFFVTALIVAISAPVFAKGPDVDTRGVDNGTSLGAVTADAIAGGFDQGAHASGAEPAIDLGRPGRAGLANAVGQKGDLSETIDLIDGD